MGHFPPGTFLLFEGDSFGRRTVSNFRFLFQSKVVLGRDISSPGVLAFRAVVFFPQIFVKILIFYGWRIAGSSVHSTSIFFLVREGAFQTFLGGLEGVRFVLNFLNRGGFDFSSGRIFSDRFS